MSIIGYRDPPLIKDPGMSLLIGASSEMITASSVVSASVCKLLIVSSCTPVAVAYLVMSSENQSPALLRVLILTSMNYNNLLRVFSLFWNNESNEKSCLAREGISVSTVSYVIY